MKKTQLKETIKAIVRQAINERNINEGDKLPDVKKSAKLNPNIVKGGNKSRGKFSGHESNPIRKAGKLGLGLRQESGLTSENGNYSEDAELELIKQIGQKVLELLAMHGSSATNTSPDSSEPEENEPEVSDTIPNPFDSPEDTDTEIPDDDSGGEEEPEEEEEEPEVSENHKVQTGPSYRTSNDSKDNPRNVRNPKLG